MRTEGGDTSQVRLQTVQHGHGHSAQQNHLSSFCLDLSGQSEPLVSAGKHVSVWSVLCGLVGRQCVSVWSVLCGLVVCQCGPVFFNGKSLSM